MLVPGNPSQSGAAVDNAYGYISSRKTYYAATKASNTGNGNSGMPIVWCAYGY